MQPGPPRWDWHTTLFKAVSVKPKQMQEEYWSDFPLTLTPKAVVWYQQYPKLGVASFTLFIMQYLFEARHLGAEMGISGINWNWDVFELRLRAVSIVIMTFEISSSEDGLSF